MTNRKMREMENRIRQALEEPYEPTDERIEEIKQRAFEEYQRYMNAHEQAKEKNEKRAQRKRSILRRVVVVAAVAVCFFVMSIVYIALQPSITANADSFVRRIAIWLNNQLHLGITLSIPMDDDTIALSTEEYTFTSLDELSKHTNMPIVYLQENDELKLSKIDVHRDESIIQLVALYYLLSFNETITIYIEPLYMSNSISIDTSLANEIQTTIGTFYLWTDRTHSRAITILSGSIVTIVSSLSLEDLEDYCYKVSTR